MKKKAISGASRLLFSTTLAIAPLAGTLAMASSHREAPFVTEHSKVDATDFYMFTSYEPGRAGYVTIIADYIPMQSVYGGPNFFTMDPEAIYEIHIDNNGDAKEDLTFQFKFTNTLNNISLDIGPAGATKKVAIPLINAGAISATDTSLLNVVETYTVNLIRGERRSGSSSAVTNADSGESTFVKPVDNIGTKSIADYDAYANAHIYEIKIPGTNATGRMFVGQRQDPFVVNLGPTFDLVNLNPLGPVNGGSNSLAGNNVTTLALEIPASVLVSTGQDVIGGWTTASLPRNRTLSKTPTFSKPDKEFGPYIQVSRLGMPLVNEAVIGIKDKDRFNASEPRGDGQFLTYVTHPTLPTLLQVLFGVRAPTAYPRNDLVEVFLTGVAGLNATDTAAEYLRLNTKTPAVDWEDQKNLGVIAGDIAGFPNGRRPGDDVVDSALRVLMGKLLDTTVAPDGQLKYTDGANVNAKMFQDEFPYLQAPLPGAE